MEKQKIDVTDRVKIFVFDGQAPHPARTHWVVVVDRLAVWHMTSNLSGYKRDMLPLARFIATQEAAWLNSSATAADTKS